MDPSAGPEPLSRMEREVLSNAFGLRFLAGWLILIFVSPLIYILIAVARNVQTPIIAAILWARAKELAGFPVSEAVIRQVVLEAARGVRKRDEARVKYFNSEAERLAAEATEAVNRVQIARNVAEGGGGDVKLQKSRQTPFIQVGAGATAPALFKDE